jgi:hypothetical protein
MRQGPTSGWMLFRRYRDRAKNCVSASWESGAINCLKERLSKQIENTQRIRICTTKLRERTRRITHIFFLNFVVFVLLWLSVCAARANFALIWNSSNTGIDSRQGAKYAKFRNRKIDNFTNLFPTFAALASLREIFRVLVAALPRWALRGDICFFLVLRFRRSRSFVV